MTIKQALKQKNKLIKKINEAFQKVYTYNSVNEGQVRPYDVNDSLQQYMKLTEELISLKEKIHIANQPVYNKIFKLSELKSMAQKIAVINCEEGKIKNKYSEDSEIKTSIINVVLRDTMVTKLESDIETIQEELDLHNSTTHI